MEGFESIPLHNKEGKYECSVWIESNYLGLNAIMHHGRLYTKNGIGLFQETYYYIVVHKTHKIS